MRPQLALGALLCLLATGCRPETTEDARFAGLAGRCLEALRREDPETATILGDHRWDDRLTDRGAGGIARRVSVCRAYLDSLRAIDQARLARETRVDCRILATRLEADLHELEVVRPQDWNPLWYHAGRALFALIVRDFAPAPARARSLKGRLEALPALTATARANLAHPPRAHVEAAIRFNEGTISHVRDDMAPLLAGDPALAAELAPARAKAIAALEDYGTWLRESLLPAADGEFRLGEAKYRRALALTLDCDLTPEQILAAAQEDLAAARAELASVSRELYARWFPDAQTKRAPTDDDVVRAVLGRLGEQRPDDATVGARARAALEEGARFAREAGFVTVPTGTPEIALIPEFLRGAAVAFYDAPGPFETCRQAFFRISPAPSAWPPDRVDAYYREYNDAMLRILAVHEGVPGHHLQAAAASRYRGATAVRAVLSSETFTEGWATYAERLMVEAGYGGPELRAQQLKTRLRTILNAILDQGIHMGGMSEAQAIDLLVSQGYQDPAEAARKWRRAVMSPCLLSAYYVGNLELRRLRADEEAKLGPAFDLRRFNDEVLSRGTLPPRYLRELMRP